MHHSCLRTIKWESFQLPSFFSKPTPTPLWVQQEPTAVNQESMLPRVQPSSTTGASLHPFSTYDTAECITFITHSSTSPPFFSKLSCSFIHISITAQTFTHFLVNIPKMVKEDAFLAGVGANVRQHISNNTACIN